MAPWNNSDLSSEILRYRRDEKQLWIRLGGEEPPNARRIATDMPRKLGLREPCRLAELVELTDNRVDLIDLTPSTLVLRSELKIVHSPGGHSLVVTGIQPLGH